MAEERNTDRQTQTAILQVTRSPTGDLFSALREA
jgi:hypothetical protein